MDISFELYKVFYYVAKNLSFSEASNKLYISQSAVSQSIKTLEDKMNSKLFIRHTKQVKLTTEGEILFKHIEQAYNFIKAGERSIDEIHSLKKGEVRIGASDTLCKYYLLDYFKHFNRIYPNIKIYITNRPSPRCIELLKSGSVDIAVVNLSEDRSQYKNMEVLEVSTIKDVFIAGKNYEHLQNKELEFKTLEQYPLIMLEKNSTTRRFIDSFLAKKEIEIKPEIELGSMDLLIEMAKIGLGISLVVEEYISKELEQGEVFKLTLKESLPTRKIGVVTNTSIPTPIAALKFVELLKGFS